MPTRRGTRTGRLPKAKARNVSTRRDEPARKYVQVMRPPGRNARFAVKMWVLRERLTALEKQELFLREGGSLEVSAQEGEAGASTSKAPPDATRHSTEVSGQPQSSSNMPASQPASATTVPYTGAVSVTTAPAVAPPTANPVQTALPPPAFHPPPPPQQ